MGRRPKNKTEIYDNELLDIEPGPEPEPMKPRYSVSEMFEDFKVLNHHDQAVFFKYMVKQTFSIEEVVNLIMDKGI